VSVLLELPYWAILALLVLFVGTSFLAGVVMAVREARAARAKIAAAQAATEAAFLEGRSGQWLP
jgi:hypothetical protein